MTPAAPSSESKGEQVNPDARLILQSFFQCSIKDSVSTELGEVDFPKRLKKRRNILDEQGGYYWLSYL